MVQEATINISGDSTYGTVITQLSKIDSNQDLKVTIDINCQGFKMAEVYLLIVSFLSSMRANGKNVEIIYDKEKECNSINYASRIDFFKNLDIEFDEKIQRHDVTGNLISIVNIKPGVYDLSKEILEIFRKDFQMSEIDVFQLSLIINEMICNTTIHSKCNAGAYLYCQKYIKTNTLEFILVDSGIGIKKSLEKNNKYSDLTNYESVKTAIEFGATCGEGRGHGLYFASEFIKRNAGFMILLSGTNRVIVGSGFANMSTNSHWNGVFLKICFKFDSKISLTSLMEEKEYSTI